MSIVALSLRRRALGDPSNTAADQTSTGFVHLKHIASLVKAEEVCHAV